MVKFSDNGDYVYFDLFGGEHSYHKKTKTYKIKRPYGIFSNLTVCIYGIFSLENQGYKVDKLEFILDEYIGNIDIYNELFLLNENTIDLSKISDEEKEYFKSQTYPTFFGLGYNINKFCFPITSQIVNKFFQPSIKVIDCYNKLLKSNDLNLNDSVFIWARKTDKVRETKIPEVYDYIKIIDDNNWRNKQIIIQTDDSYVFEEFKKTNLNFTYIKEIPFSKKDNGFHARLDMISEEDFYKDFGMNKINYIIQMYSVAMIAKNSLKTILYPGNPTTFVPMMRGSFDGCIMFKDNKNTF